MKLKKGLNLLDVFCIASGAMISGLFILPGLAYEQAGPGVLAAYVLAGILALTGVLSQAELASAMPKAGGTYFYVTRSMGAAVGTVYGLITWLSLALKSAYEILFMAGMAVILIKLNVHIIAILFCLLFLAINLVGVKEAGRVQVYLVMGILAALALFCLCAYPSMHARNFQSQIPVRIESMISTAGFVFISFGGLLKIASVAEEVKNPGRALPLAMIQSLAIISLVYIIVIFVSIAVQGNELAGAKMPIASTASTFLGSFGKYFFAVAAVLAIITAANAGIMAASRYPLALARDEMLPEILCHINRRFQTPHPSILLTGLIIMAAFFVDIKILVKAASSVLILTYLFTCLAVIILRESHVQNYQPQFRSPFYPWVQVGGMVGFLVLLFGIGLEALLVTCVLAVLGFLVYWFYGRASADQEFALLHLVERITARELTTHSLETELKDIIHERDEVLKDRFDHLIEACPVLDIEESITLDDFFRRAAVAMAEDLHVDSDTLFHLFLEREKESSTVLNPFLAIPHIIIEGEHHFDILLARCKEGIVFSDDAPQVHTVFMLIGTKDERPFHLTSLAAICQIVQDPEFESRWMKAKKTETLRDIVLLGKRKRHV